MVGERVTPLVVQELVGRSSEGRLVVSTIDRHGNEFYPSADHWDRMPHSFYRLKFHDEKGSYHVVGDLVIPQVSLHASSSVLDCVRTILQNYPAQGPVARKERSYHLPTGNHRDIESFFFEPVILKPGDPLPGRSIMYGGDRACVDCYACSLCERREVDPRAELFLS